MQAADMESPGQADRPTSGAASLRETQSGAEKNEFRPSTPRNRSDSSEPARPPLPPRPMNVGIQENETTSPNSSPRLGRLSSKSNLQSGATTALSLADISTQIFPDGSRETHSSTPDKASNLQDVMPKASISRMTSRRGSDAGDTASIRSYVPNTAAAGDLESIFGDFPGRAGWNSAVVDNFDSFDLAEFQDEDTDLDFSDEFEPIGELDSDGHNEELLLEKWKAKRKHFFILSAAGKPIYTSHGDDSFISNYIGIIQTIISFYQESDDTLKSFSAGGTKFVIISQGSLYLVAISRLFESESQLRIQLEALYMQILSTLTLPALNHLFSVRPSTDLRRPLQGTESLLSALADNFTRGSPSTLLSALECLKIRKSHRQTINNTLLKMRVNSLLYGLVVAGGRLVSVVRPKKHSLHPGDLQLIFNMVFEAGGVKAGGGENWIPICLPGFNSNGYLYMYVSFLDIHEEDAADDDHDKSTSRDDSIAIVLISADKEGFFELQGMRNSIIEQMEANGSIAVMKTAVEKGRPQPTDIVPGTVLRHFLYKSKANVQFTMSSYSPDFSTLLAHRRLLSIYHTLHSSIHAKQAHIRVYHNISKSASALAWSTPIFELYCVAGPNANRNALSQSAGKVVQWVQREEERVFIIGGAVF